MSEATVPVLILREGASRTRGRDAQRNNILAAKIVTETIRTTLGPQGMDKMLVSGMGDVVITNDGATIMKELDVQHPAAKMLVEVAKSQDNEVGDGTTTAVVLAGELLTKAEKLLDQEVHPTVIVEGYKKASEKALEILQSLAMDIKRDDEKDAQVGCQDFHGNQISFGIQGPLCYTGNQSGDADNGREGRKNFCGHR
jgi:archaeal chaperonin